MRRKALELTLLVTVVVTAIWALASPGFDSILALLFALAALLGLEVRGRRESLVLSFLERWRPRNRGLAERTYFKYRNEPHELVNDAETIAWLEQRYACAAFQFGGQPVPATVLWENHEQLIAPDSILGELDRSQPKPLDRSPLLEPRAYARARAFIKAQYESGPVTYEGVDYRMTRIDRSSITPKIHGALGWYYDCILTQYAMEWELKRARGSGSLPNSIRPGDLPLREAVEAGRNPLLDGGGRCAAITVSTLLVFGRRDGLWFLIRQRSREVGVSAGLLHVVPAGMFEAPNTADHWSVEMNVWRELLEEVYDEREQQGSASSELPDNIRAKAPVPLLRQLLEDGKAEFSATGICCDLLNLRPELCTILFVRDPRFCESRRMNLNWEYEPQGRSGRFALPWGSVDDFVEGKSDRGRIVPSGAVCLGLGRKWMAARHSL